MLEITDVWIAASQEAIYQTENASAVKQHVPGQETLWKNPLIF